jgi:DNA-binding transcriptional LysR family regulator
MQFNSIEGIKTAVSLGLGAAFVSSSAIEKEIELKQLKFLKLKIFELHECYPLLRNPECYKSKAFEFFYNELYQLKKYRKLKDNFKKVDGLKKILVL